MLFISEPYRDFTMAGTTYLANRQETAASWIRDPRISILGSGSGPDHAWVHKREATYVSVYLSPNCHKRDIKEKVEALQDTIRDLGGNVIVAGDFNARAIE